MNSNCYMQHMFSSYEEIDPLSIAFMACLIGILAAVVFGLTLLLCRKKRMVCLISFSLLIGIFAFVNIFFLSSIIPELVQLIIRGELNENQEFNLIYSAICSVVFCVPVVFLLWTWFISEGEKRKKLWISGGVAIAISAFMVGTCLFQMKGSSIPEGITNLMQKGVISYLLLVLTCVMGISAIVSLVLVLCKCRKNKRAYLVPLSLFVLALIFGFILTAIQVFYMVWVLSMIWWGGLFSE